jgi:hypothetical protein
MMILLCSMRSPQRQQRGVAHLTKLVNCHRAGFRSMLFFSATKPSWCGRMVFMKFLSRAPRLLGRAYMSFTSRLIFALRAASKQQRTGLMARTERGRYRVTIKEGDDNAGDVIEKIRWSLLDLDLQRWSDPARLYRQNGKPRPLGVQFLGNMPTERRR